MNIKKLSCLFALSLAALGAQASQRVCEYQLIPTQVYATGLLEQGLQLPLLVDSYLPTNCSDGPAGVVQPVLLIPGGGFNWVERDREKIVEIAAGPGGLRGVPHRAPDPRLERLRASLRNQDLHRAEGLPTQPEEGPYRATSTSRR